MSTKTKNNSKTIEQVSVLAAQGGIVLMAAAATLGLIELPEHFSAALAPAHTNIITAPNRAGDDSNTLRREREEAGPHYISYSVAQRTPGRTGRQ